jgi:hypothetical protein
VATTTNDVLGHSPINSTSSLITINHIFSHNHNWDVYRYEHIGELRSVEIEEVEKMLSCGEQGYCMYLCPNCGELKVIHFGCNSRVCTHCGKKFTDKWADSIARKTFDVKHRHVVLTIPEELRSIFYKSRTLLKMLMDCAISTISNVMEWKLNHKAIPGIVVVVHTYGKDMKFNPHLHCLVTEGGFKTNGIWVNMNYFPYRMLRTSWQYQLLTTLKERLENTPENSKLIDSLFKKYPEGFYVRAKDTINNKKGMIKYIGRYIRHPAVAESRIISYDSKEVIFWYKDDDGITYYVTMGVEEFIHAVIDHIPGRQFKTIRHYGVYSRGIKRKFKRLLGMVSIAQQKLTKSLGSWVPECPNCGCRMEFVWLGKGKPPPKLEFGERISDWNYICLR